MVKGKRFLSILTTAIILAMLIAVIPVSPVLAAERITVSPTSGEIDDYVDIDCSSFSSEEDEVYFYFSDEDIDVDDEVDVDELDSYEYIEKVYTEGDTSFEGNFDVPGELTDGDDRIDVESGDYYIYASYTNEGEIVAKDEFRVIVIGLSISPDEGTVGTKVTVTGSGFEDNEEIEITFGSTDVTDDIEGDDETRSNGSFTSYFYVPESVAGKHDITVEVDNDEAEAEFTVEPDIEIDPEEGAVNDRILVTGTGFARMEDFTVTFDGIDVGGDTTGGSGSFETHVNVPELGAGEYDVEAEDDDNNSATATFTISTDVSISPTTSASSPGYVGDELTISGTGFQPSSEITITYTSDPVTFYTTSESDGSFSYTFEVPPSQSGEHTITATDGTSSMSVNFFLESTPPTTPQPLEPYMDGKAKSLAYFDWEDVTADIDGVVEQSLPITYDLQVATDENFTNRVVNKTGLTTSEYTLTEDEALEKTTKETPYYYWRIRAVDAASNASPWTGAGTFSLGFSFDFDLSGGWLLYVLIGVGALVLFFVGFWLGRRGGGGDYY
jgi:hypothetical protein